MKEVYIYFNGKHTLIQKVYRDAWAKTL